MYITIKMRFVDTRVSYRQTDICYTIKVNTTNENIVLCSSPRILCEFIPMKTQLTQNQNVVLKSSVP